MKKWGFILIILICLGFAFTNVQSYFDSKINIENSYDQNDGGRDTSGNVQTKEITKEQIYLGNLLLVNSEFPVHQQSMKSDVVHLTPRHELTQNYVLMGSDIYLSEDVAREFSTMILSAEKEGLHNFAITSGFRNLNEQELLYQQMGSDYALPPGNSEHNLGLSLDVGSTQMKMASAPEGKWLEKNAWKYGFILRYPKDKSKITGIQYEPWHIRYVGLPHSAIMQEKNFVLEEYLDFLKGEKQITAHFNEEKYNITYYPITENTTIEVPENHPYQISGNNIDGVIVTEMVPVTPR
ncbi:VanY-A/VanY-F/VanY-M family D-Ala-D-Ala carboxypeptidase [Bacillus marasmi]|uniref:VanY-A/VanY-F/VanY-M family D-Ala-D-Ala carboxypeptidase n=1 Tax=Bacillus marasmi TaxID=1926279 RepID=UPI0011C925ED|nr:VanY-A/VanY-F/VanY-M family D-Ala-D-Ala carboxypeptidase [Bacillus marasmi]